MISARDWYVRMCEMIGCQAHHRRPRRTAVFGKNGRPRLTRGRMQNVAIVAALLVSAMFQMWFSCGERRRSPNVRGLVLTFCGQGAKVCAAFILRKTVWPFCDGCAHGRPGHVFPHRAGSRFCEAKSPLYIYQYLGAHSAVRRSGWHISCAVCCAAPRLDWRKCNVAYGALSVGMPVALRAAAILHARQICAAAGPVSFFTDMSASPKFGFR